MTEKIDGMSMDIEQAQRDKLQTIFPECFTEARLDIDKLLSLCGEYITDDFEKYEFKWKGKSDCLRLAQKRSTATLRPCTEESVNFDTTQNLYIEGDNLEVLKLLQRSYFRKVKMIYIDPPYNTGNDFVYEDDFADPLARYKEVTQQTTKSNPETMGRYHTNWLNMMYPRLRLAANLLRDDGVIFISIDDVEVTNLRKLCDEVFGEENFIDTVVWEKRYSPQNAVQWFSESHDFILVYAKRKDLWFPNLLERTEEMNARYKNLDDDPRGPWKAENATAQGGHGTASQFYVLRAPNGKEHHPTAGRCWVYTEKVMNEMIADNRVWFGSDGNNVPALKRFLTEVKQGTACQTIWRYNEVGHNQEGKKEIKDLFESVPFDTPKPTRLLKRIVKLATNQDDIILDFFSGSATTAHSVMQLNADDGGNRRFICVQLPEVCDEKSDAFNAGYQNICEIGKERIRRAGKKILEADGGQIAFDGDKAPLDIGFKVFKLDSSNMKLWDDTPIEGDDVDTLLNRMNGNIDGLKADRSDTDLVYEILLKMGYPLTENVTALDIDGLTVCAVADNRLLICLQPGVTAGHIEKMAAYQPQKIAIAEDALADNSAMSNAHYLLENKGIELKIV
ncbi:site-specific DNA-methyltransferase [Paenibacillus alginolyticus]|uniref:site-specific DNA-methyltransferase n=1 Tax=Paenibacillus alginolyticus TaxID=59839 RepID=UPI000414F460|nr:site-specific DNA-methyltransferase [Paenibacillus alginolyticus]MCY9664890.1 site-specific DNA-methyltransferase [Paenibacillus alginolyticus]